MQKLKAIILLHLVLIILSYNSTAYSMNPDESGVQKTVHQHITNESKLIWKLMPYEIKNQLTNPINKGLDSPFTANFDYGDDVITGSGEEDLAFDVNTIVNSNHFWQPDEPTIISGVAYYDNGMGPFKGSCRQALEYWTKEVIPLYISGDANESYYWLGRVAHLLEDATVPAHMHLDEHPIFDNLESVNCLNMEVDKYGF